MNIINNNNVTSSDNYYRAMDLINQSTFYNKQYEQLSSNPEWKDRFDGFFKGTKTLPLLYDPFFKAIFNPDTHRELLSEFISVILGQEIQVLEVLPNENSTYMGALIIMDIVVKMADGSLANIEVQKVPYLFPAERISCYSSDLLMRQYTRLKNASLNNKNRFSYNDLHHVHTIIFYEKSSKALKSCIDEKLYFHVGKTVFNTKINVELLQDFHLISLDTFIKYRYSNIISGDTTITGYDYDDSVYKTTLDDNMKQKRLMYLMLLTTDNVSDLNRLLNLYPEISGIVSDMNEYIARPQEVLNMFSEALQILDKNSMDLLIDEMKQEVDKTHAQLDDAKTQLYKTNAQLNSANAQLNSANAEIEQLKAEIAALKAQQ